MKDNPQNTKVSLEDIEKKFSGLYAYLKTKLSSKSDKIQVTAQQMMDLIFQILMFLQDKKKYISEETKRSAIKAKVFLTQMGIKKEAVNAKGGAFLSSLEDLVTDKLKDPDKQIQEAAKSTLKIIYEFETFNEKAKKEMMEEYSRYQERLLRYKADFEKAEKMAEEAERKEVQEEVAAV